MFINVFTTTNQVSLNWSWRNQSRPCHPYLL